jgi:mannosylglycerate hydrolase
MNANNIIIVPETHWDREWYIPFQEYRARLILMFDKLLTILKTDPEYHNFTFDGQIIPIEDYLEACPEREIEVKKYVSERRLSIGPMYVLPDEFLISGESLIRNLLIGRKIALKFGRVMKAGYIPDPFGHIAQLPQILSNCEINSVLFRRGFGDEFEKGKLNMEFIWQSPGESASIIAIHLILGYGSAAELKTTKREGRYDAALRKIRRIVIKLEKYTSTPVILLNNGSDHHEARPEIPDIIKQWNEKYPDKTMEQNDFEYYIEKVRPWKHEFRKFIGELRYGKYDYILTGVLSSRMWIKQMNNHCETLLETYAEPISTITWSLDKYFRFVFPRSYLHLGWKWLIKNHPHDSICGCSIDQVHNEMKTRFDWAKQIAREVFKNSVLYLSKLIKKEEKEDYYFIVYNPLPWKRRENIKFQAVFHKLAKVFRSPKNVLIVDYQNKVIQYQDSSIELDPRYKQEGNQGSEISFIDELPALGYKLYYIKPNPDSQSEKNLIKNVNAREASIENEYYKVIINTDGKIELLEKSSGIWYDKLCFFQDSGDWGDEYDFSGPKENQVDIMFTSEDLNVLEIKKILDGLPREVLFMLVNLNLPESLVEDRYNRSNFLVSNLIEVYINLYDGINRVDFKVKINNNSKDHRLRLLFKTNILSKTVNVDGHFLVIPRDVNVPEGKDWVQKPMGTNHQRQFISVFGNGACFSLLNKGLPEYEAIKEQDNTITLALTLLRSIGWLSRGDLASRKSNAGPDLSTPGAQCLGIHEYDFSLIIEHRNENWKDSKIHLRAREFNCPPKVAFPKMIETPMRISNMVFFEGFELIENHIFDVGEKIEPFLPPELSFMTIDNPGVMMSAVKKSEVNNDLIIRIYNVTEAMEISNLIFHENFKIVHVEIVNSLEEPPDNPIKAKILGFTHHNIKVELNPHVIATLRLDIESGNKFF